MIRAWIRRLKPHVVIVVGAGTVLFVLLALTEWAWMPRFIDGPMRAFYRLLFLATLPGRFGSMLVWPPEDYTWPTQTTPVTAYLTAAFYYGVWRAVGYPLVWYLRHGPLRTGVPQPAPPTLSRRNFLASCLVGVPSITVGGMAGYCALIEPAALTVQRYAMPIRGLPQWMDGLRVVHISDTHYGPYLSLGHLRRVLDRVNGLKPDLVLLTGDYVHRTTDTIRDGIGVFAELSPRYGSIAVLGNHDHWEGAAACQRRFADIGIPLVDNRRLYLGPDGISEKAKEGQSLCIAGLGDAWEDRVSFADALDGAPAETPRIVLSHHPDLAEHVDGLRRRVDLMLAGHTHGGQVSLPRWGSPFSGSRYGARYLGGLTPGRFCPVIVSRGVGMTVLPVRFRVTPEIGLITLTRRL